MVTRQGRGGSQGLRLRAYSCAAHPAAARPTCSPLLCAVSWTFLSLRTTPTEPECASALWALSGALLELFPGSQSNVLEQRTTVTILCQVASSVLSSTNVVLFQEWKRGIQLTQKKGTIVLTEKGVLDMSWHENHKLRPTGGVQVGAAQRR